MAKIGINASFLRKQNTGIGQVSINFLRKLIELTTNNLQLTTGEVILYLEEDIDLALPKNFSKHVFLPIYKRDDLIRKIWWEKCLLPKMVNQDKCDVLLSLYQSSTIRPFKAGKHIMVVHDIIPKLFPNYLNNFRKKVYWKLTEKAIKSADKIIAVSKRTEKDLVQHLGIDAAKISVAYISTDEIFEKTVSPEENARVMRKYGLSSGYIYHGGGLEVRKNAEGVLRAYKRLLERNKKLHFVHEIPKLVISGKMMPQLAPLITDVERRVHELNLGPHVKLLGFTAQEDMPALYANASMFLFPSHYEGFGIPVLEAMKQGKSVITSKTSSLPEVGGDSVLYCNADDVEDIAMVMKNVLTNKHLRETLSERARRRAEQFSWEKFVGKVLNIISST